jgi:hypothetical protein
MKIRDYRAEDATEIARPFFEGVGFVLERKNRVERDGQTLTNF